MNLVYSELIICIFFIMSVDNDFVGEYIKRK
jgi:hypothetical protein